jgi:hypothetical protein
MLAELFKLAGHGDDCMRGALIVADAPRATNAKA